ncbi:pectate lyase family protein [Verrucosispora sioxanthis]|uniref:Polysaccharide lyase family 1 protein n=1 Tax=Verrucosispora sioxanthis TaxID=2499994 RepID=A0A6M1LDU2_9ACTN|nr:polysaccharide lyase family 1 protein [Verrucosispora sioxanthis]NEE67251.1 polysaccharide lyase family 1 protein [Verrucosispora sioxanthis]NGM16361.1 polysaccharide lyase family 1 protein [Verrucosispora sioxanthis]
MRRLAAAAASTIIALTVLPTAAVAQPSDDAGTPSGNHRDRAVRAPLSTLARQLGRQALPAGDGWAAAGPGTTGGSAAAAEQIHVVSSRAELVAALGGDNATNATNATAKIVYVSGDVDGFEAADGRLLDCADLADPGYSLEAYLAAYDPAVWGLVAPSGPLEEARRRSVTNQTHQTQINVGPNTTIIGLRGARLTGLTLMIDRATNVIVRNITFDDARDCFPAWSPTDGEAGNWNSQYDLVSVRRSENVWIDHNTFTDGDNPDSAQPVYFGRPYQVHDGALDITHTASLVTVSWNRFSGRDKLMLIGSSNTVGPDVGRLNVTLHHNFFDGGLQRLPRVRFGQVDVYNNAYRLGGDGFQYAIGVGVQSAVHAESNHFTLGADVSSADLLYDWGGTAITTRGNWVSSAGAPSRPVDLVAAYNAGHDPDLGPDAGWTPTLRHGPVLPAPLVPLVVRPLAGADRLPL